MEMTTAFLLSTLCTFLMSSLGQDTSVPLPEFVTHPKEYSFIVKQQPVTLTCEAYDAMDITFNCLGVKIDPERQQIFQSFAPETGRILVKATVDVTYNEVRGFEDYWCECYAWTSAGAMKDEDDNTPQYILSRRGFVMIPYLQKEFDVEPTSQVVEEDSEVELKCVAPDGNPEPTIFWKKGGHRVNPEQDNNLVVTQSGSLVIQNFQMTDEGEYTCVAKNLAGKVESSAATLTLQDYIVAGETHLFNEEPADEPAKSKIFMKQPEKMYYVTENSPVPMSCTVKGADILEFRCNGNRIDEKKIDKEVENERVAADRIIKSVYRISKSDIDDFKRQADPVSCTCYAWYMKDGNWAGEESTGATVKIAELGKFNAKMKDMTVAPGSTVSFTCRAPRGTPKPKVVWTLNGRQLKGNERFRVTPNMLTIQKVRPRDAGNVACIVQNVAGTREISARLMVSDDAEMVDSSKETTDFPTTLMTTAAPGTPMFTEYLEDVYYTSRRQPAMLSCGFSGARILTFRCNGIRLPQDQLKVEENIDRQTREQTIKASVDIQLGAVNSFTEQQSTDYTCMCVAWYMKPDKSWATVESNHATVRPAFMQNNFMVEPRDVTVSVGRTAVFECVPPHGGPEPTVSWTKDNQNVDTSNRRFEMAEDGSLTIFEVRRRDEGEYACVATNSAKTSYSRAARLTVSDHAVDTTVAVEPEAQTTEAPQPETTEEMMETTTMSDLSSGIPIFIRQPDSVSYIIRNRAAKITCRTLGAEYLEFECNGAIIPEQFGDVYSEIEPETGKKILERSINVTRDDIEAAGGVMPYECRCSAMYADPVKQQWAKLHKTGNVEIAYLRKKFQKDPVSKTVDAGDAVEIPCMAPNANPQPTISWERDGAPMDEEADHSIIISSEGSLIFNSILMEDEGNYTCVAENVAGRRVSMAAEIKVSETGEGGIKPEPEPETTPEPVDPVVSVAVDGPPVFVMQLEKTSYVVKGGSVTLTCAAKQTGKISFMCNGEEIDDDRVILQDAEIDDEMALKASLDIMSEAVEDLDEAYACECLAWYKLSENEPEQYVNSEGGLIELAYLEETFAREPEDKVSPLMKTVNFKCVIPKGFPRPMTSWSKNGEKIIFESNGNLVMPGDGSLVIVQVQVSDAGSYTCSATNTAGTRTSRVATLTVMGDSTTSIPEPEPETTAEMIEGNFTDGETNVTSDVMPTAEYTTDSMPENTTMYIELGTDGKVIEIETTPEPVPEGEHTGTEIDSKYCQNTLNACNRIGSNMRCSKNHIDCAKEFMEQCERVMEDVLIQTVSSVVQECMQEPGGGEPDGTTGNNQEGAKDLPHQDCMKLQICYSQFLPRVANPMAFDTHESCADLRQFLDCAHDAMTMCNIDSNKDASASLTDISSWFNEFCTRLPRRKKVEEQCSAYKRCPAPIDFEITPEKVIDIKYWCNYISKTSECRQMVAAEKECKVMKKQKMKMDLHYLETQAHKYCPKLTVTETETKQTGTGINVDKVGENTDKEGSASMTTASVLVSTIVQVLAVLVISFR